MHIIKEELPERNKSNKINYNKRYDNIFKDTEEDTLNTNITKINIKFNSKLNIDKNAYFINKIEEKIKKKNKSIRNNSKNKTNNYLKTKENHRSSSKCNEDNFCYFNNNYDNVYSPSKFNKKINSHTKSPLINLKKSIENYNNDAVINCKNEEKKVIKIRSKQNIVELSRAYNNMKCTIYNLPKDEITYLKDISYGYFIYLYDNYYQKIPNIYKKYFEFDPKNITANDIRNVRCRFIVNTDCDIIALCLFKVDYSNYLNKRYCIIHISHLFKDRFTSFLSDLTDIITREEHVSEIILPLIHETSKTSDETLPINKEFSTELKKINYKWKIVKNDEFNRRTTIFNYKHKVTDPYCTMDNKYYNSFSEGNMIDPIKIYNFGVFSNSNRLYSGRTIVKSDKRYFGTVYNNPFLSYGINLLDIEAPELKKIGKEFEFYEGIAKHIKMDDITKPYEISDTINNLFPDKKLKELNEDKLTGDFNSISIMRNFIRPLIFEYINSTKKLKIKYNYTAYLQGYNETVYYVKTMDPSSTLFIITVNDNIYKRIINNNLLSEICSKAIILLKDNKEIEEEGHIFIPVKEYTTELMLLSDNPKILTRSKISISDNYLFEDYINNEKEDALNNIDLNTNEKFIIGLIKSDLSEASNSPLFAMLINK